jgi:hypothetical protein
MLRVLFDFVGAARSNPIGAGISDSRPFDKLRAGSSQKSAKERGSHGVGPAPSGFDFLLPSSLVGYFCPALTADGKLDCAPK